MEGRVMDKVNYILRIVDAFEKGDREDVIMHIGFSDENDAFEYAKGLADKLMAMAQFGDKMCIEQNRDKRGVLSCCVCKYYDFELVWACRMTVEPVIGPAEADGIVSSKILV